MASILVVEDNTYLNQAYSLILTKEGYEVDVAFDGEEALEKIKKKKPDIMLLDLLMPKMGGIEVLKHLSKDKKNDAITILILSNLSDDEEVAEARKLGASKYILKAHASPQELAVRVRHLLRKF